jgi:hypothetical protein
MRVQQKKILKWSGIIVLVPVLLFIIFSLLLYFPPFQNWAIGVVSSYASQKTGMEISIAHVNLRFPLDLSIDGFKMIQQNDSLPQVKDTVADAGNLVVNIQLMPLFHQQVEVDALKFSKLKVNTTNFIHKARIKGTLGQLSLESHGIDLSKQTLRVNTADFADAKVNIELSDTVPPDTSKTKTFWKIYADKLNIKNVDVTVHMPGDTLQVEAYMGRTVASGGYFDLFKGLYSVKKFDWNDGRLKYDNNFKTFTKGLDYNHIFLTGVNIGIDSLSYCDPKLNLHLRSCAFKEKSGIEVNDFSGPISLDSTRLYLPALNFRTPESSLTANFEMDLNAFANQDPGKIKAIVHGSFGKQDLMMFMGSMPVQFRKRWPNYPLAIDGVIRGNMNRIGFAGLRVKLPTAFNISADGYVANPTDMKHIRADIGLNAHTYNLGFITAMLDPSMMKMVHIPNGIAVDGDFHINGKKYAADFIAKEGGGRINAKAQFDAVRMAYQAKATAVNFQVQHFVPNYGLTPFTGYVEANGVGTDVMSPRTHLSAKARVVKFKYGGYNLDNINALATIRNGVAHADIDSRNSLLKGLIKFDALMNTKRLEATVSCDLSKADLYHLRIMDQQITVGMCAHADVSSNMKDYYKVQGRVSDVTIYDGKKFYRPEDVVMDVLTSRDTTHAVVDCGDFHLNMDSKGGYERLIKHGTSLVAELQKQLKDKYINQLRLRERLPLARIYLVSGKNNFFCRIMKKYGYQLNNIFMDMTSSPVAGLNGKMEIDSLYADSVLLDTVRLDLASTDKDMNYHAQIRNNKKNPQYCFNALVNGGIYEKGTRLTAKIFDENDKLGLGFGISAAMEQKGIKLHFFGDDPVLGYKTFHVNDSNYVFLGDDRRVSADLELKASDGTGVQVFTNDENTEALQDITVSLNKFDLEKILSVLPYTPDVSGIMNGDFHVIQTKDEVSVSSSLSVDNMVYEHCPMGNVSSEFVYMPKSDGSHYVDGILMSDGQKVATLTGTYKSAGEGYLDAKLGMERTPLSLVNGFIPNQLIGFKGYGEGALTIKGSLSKPQVNGEVYLDSAYLVSVPYGVELRFDNDPVRIVGSHLLFENFEMYAHNDSPLDVSGYFSFADMDNMYLDMKMRARNFQIIDAKKNLRSEAYGKAYVNFMGMMKGPLESLQMRGRLDVLGSTDMTYVLRDSPLSTDNQLDGLVEFTSFQDAKDEVVKRPPLTGFDMDMTMNVDENAHIFCALNADMSNYVDLIGGGNLRMQYNTVDNLRLTGRYTLSNGEMKYSLPVIPLKTFTIQDGSYIEFTGDAMNPKLSITAKERTKAPVSEDGGSSRSVYFDCGVVITKTLKDMGLEFIIDAPEDMSIHNQLQTMSVEERGKLAVTMLTTGMYLADGNTSGFTMNSALSSFLQSQINSISGKALRTLDLSFGLDNTTDASGMMHTDYSFKFAKRFWNNRLRIVVGGKVSTGSEVANQNKSFFDNVTFEYRLSDTSNKYLKLFYERDSYDWLEGYLGEYGAGFLWKRKVQHFKDLFRFGNDTSSQPMPPEPSKDSIKVSGNEVK